MFYILQYHQRIKQHDNRVMGSGIWNAQGEECALGFGGGNLMERLYLEDLGMDGMILRWILRTFPTFHWTILPWDKQFKKRFLGLHDTDGKAPLRCLKLQTKQHGVTCQRT